VRPSPRRNAGNSLRQGHAAGQRVPDSSGRDHEKPQAGEPVRLRVGSPSSR